MKARYLRHKLSVLTDLPGVLSVALVEADTGLVWESDGETESLEHVAEAASNFWRLYERMGTAFGTLGDLRTIQLRHQHCDLRLTPCGRGVLLVTVTAAGEAVDEAALQQKAEQLGVLVER